MFWVLPNPNCWAVGGVGDSFRQLTTENIVRVTHRGFNAEGGWLKVFEALWDGPWWASVSGHLQLFEFEPTCTRSSDGERPGEVGLNWLVNEPMCPWIRITKILLLSWYVACTVLWSRESKTKSQSPCPWDVCVPWRTVNLKWWLIAITEHLHVQ